MRFNGIVTLDNDCKAALLHALEMNIPYSLTYLLWIVVVTFWFLCSAILEDAQLTREDVGALWRLADADGKIHSCSQSQNTSLLKVYVSM